MNKQKSFLNCRDRQVYENIINANRKYYEEIIAQMEADNAAEIADKDAEIEYYKHAAEIATRSKYRALNSKSERRKDLMAYGAAVLFVVVAVWLAVMSLHEFSLWAGGA
jgi:hypothetical protein